MNIYQRLAALPLFQGMSTYDLMQIASEVRLDFSTIGKGMDIVGSHATADRVVFVIAGSVRRLQSAYDGTYRLEEVIPAPCVLRPERLFGRTPYYLDTFVADADDTQLMVVSKDDIRDKLFAHPAFHLSYLNAVCSAVQVFDTRLWTRYPQTVLGRFLYFVGIRSLRPSGHKEVYIDMLTLARELVTTRRNVSAMLGALRDEGLISLKRGHIIIPHYEHLLMKIKRLPIEK